MPAYRLVREGFVDESGTVSRALRLVMKSPAAEWQRAQENSWSQYHERLERVPEPLQMEYRLFDHYIAAATSHAPGPNVLDVGCGISRRFPPYAATLERLRSQGRVIYAGLDPLNVNVEDRAYPFLNGRLEDLAGTLTHGFDVFVFATSLDHLEDVEHAAREVRRLANAGAISIFWVGLHDCSYVARSIGSDLMGRYFRDASLGSLVAGTLRVIPRIPLTAMRLAARERRLARARALDDLHSRFFTERTLLAALAEFGSLIDLSRLPGSNSVFATVAVAPPAS